MKVPPGHIQMLDETSVRMWGPAQVVIWPPP
jgi:hypothetical protein